MLHYLEQSEHWPINMLPWSSDNLERSNPDLRCSPSIFWETWIWKEEKYNIFPSSCTNVYCCIHTNVVNMICSGKWEESHVSKCWFRIIKAYVDLRLQPFFLQGPHTLRTSAIIKVNITYNDFLTCVNNRKNNKSKPEEKQYLKSGIPAEQLIPAPVWTTTCLAFLIKEARMPTLSATSSALSNF